jgi:acyl-CoA reductase-like NAD-dependent aldehyde dehydrogenase
VSQGEVNTAIARMRALVELSDKALATEQLTAADGFSKRIAHEPIGVVLALCPWNYPVPPHLPLLCRLCAHRPVCVFGFWLCVLQLLCAVNTVATAVLSGNSVLIKMSDRTPLCADHFTRAFEAAGAPQHLVQSLHIGHAAVAKLLKHPLINFVTFTGSVSGGRAVYSKTAAHRFIDVVCGSLLVMGFVADSSS